jgi:hypothetical protein
MIHFLGKSPCLFFDKGKVFINFHGIEITRDTEKHPWPLHNLDILSQKRSKQVQELK